MVVRLGLALIVLLLAAGGCGPTAKMYHQEGLREYRLGNYDAARGMFRAALLKKPEKQESAYYLARCARIAARRKLEERDVAAAMRELDKAIFHYGQAIESYPGYAAAIEEKTEALELKGKYDEALELSIWAKDHGGRTVRQIVNVAREYEQRGDMDASLTRYRQAIAVEPDSALAYAELGRFFARLGRTADGVRALETAYRLSPSEPGVANDLARLRPEVGQQVRPAGSLIPPDDDGY